MGFTFSVKKTQLFSQYKSTVQNLPQGKPLRLGLKEQFGEVGFHIFAQLTEMLKSFFSLAVPTRLATRASR
ncbi:hypothetical protein Hamer_G000697 [Homarus americanus]|uniref:Uncharacterized protein n=1 Tax=Homarus americanus TaxID=6706 RepID=A0A8J5N245_HOMAM|nr:hypothetical protein Hamer_G000697 [Homarus americanus]